MEKMGMKRGA
jgi:hypothetical protein